MCLPSYYFDLVTGANCYTMNEIPRGKGVVLGTLTGQVNICTGVAGCSSCTANWLQCSECSTGKYLDLVTKTHCYEENEIPFGKGKVAGNGVSAVNVCENGCLNCKENRGQCSLCDKAQDYWLDSNTCVFGPDIPNGKGRYINAADSTGSLLSCKIGFCQVCKSNYSVCETCQDNYNLVDGVCKEVPQEESSNTWKYIVGGCVGGGLIVLVIVLSKKKSLSAVGNMTGNGSSAGLPPSQKIESIEQPKVEGKPDAQGQQKDEENMEKNEHERNQRIDKRNSRRLLKTIDS